MITYVFQLCDRTLSLFIEQQGAEPTQIELSGPETDELPYDFLFQALRTGIEEMAHHAGLLRATNDRTWDPDELCSLMESGDLQIRLTGEAREIAVAEFYIENELDVDSGIILESEDNREPIYETYGFAADLDPLNRLAEFRTEFQEMGEQLHYIEKLNKRIELDGEKVKKDGFEIGILGQTGAGKSTFINGLLGRRIMSVGDEVCTGTSIRIGYAESPAEEGIEVDFFPIKKLEQERDKVQEQLRRVKEGRNDRVAGYADGSANSQKGQERAHSSSNRYQRDAEILKLEEALEKFDRYEGCFARSDTRYSLESLEKFVSVANENYLPKFVASVDMKLAHPLLEYITLVDTPGLRDPDVDRRRRSLDTVAELDGWIYLVEAERKRNQTVVEDLREIRNQANNEHGIIVLSKSDAATSSSETSGLLDNQVEAKRKFYGQHTEHRISHCSARGPEQVALAESCDEPSVKQKRLVRLMNEPYGFPFIRRRVPMITDDIFADDALKTGFKDELRRAATKGNSRLLADIMVESSGLIAVVRQIARLLNETILSAEFQKGRGHLKEVTQKRLKWLDKKFDHIETQIEKSNTRQEMEEELEADKVELKEARRRVNKARDTKETLLAFFDEAKTKIRSELENNKSQLISDTEEYIEKELENYRWTVKKGLIGDLEVNLFDVVDVPVSKLLSGEIKSAQSEFLRRVAISRVSDRLPQMESRLGSEVQGFSLHVSRSERWMGGQLKLFEFFDTAKERMTNRAESSVSNCIGTLRKAAMKKIDRLSGEAEEEINEWVHDFEEDVDALEKNIQDWQQLIEETEAELEASLDTLKVQRSNVAVDREKLQEFHDKVFRSAPEREPRASALAK